MNKKNKINYRKAYSYKIISRIPEIKNIVFWKNKLSINEVKNNILQVGDSIYLIIVDQYKENKDNEFITGRFLKLRFDVPYLFDKSNGSTDLIKKLNDNEYVSEISHFIINLNDFILIGEYNNSAIRYFTNTLELYLKKKLGYDVKDDVLDIIPMRNIHSVEQLKKEKKIKNIQLRVRTYSLTEQEKREGLPFLGSFYNIGENISYSIKISKTKDSGSFLNTEYIKNFALNNKDNFQQFEQLIVSTSVLFNFFKFGGSYN